MLINDTGDNFVEDDLEEPKYKDLSAESDDTDGAILGGHQIPAVNEIENSHEDAGQFSEPVASPLVTDKEDPLSGSASDNEPIDIDDQGKAVGLNVDEEEEIPKPLGED